MTVVLMIWLMLKMWLAFGGIDRILMVGAKSPITIIWFSTPWFLTFSFWGFFQQSIVLSFDYVFFVSNFISYVPKCVLHFVVHILYRKTGTKNPKLPFIFLTSTSKFHTPFGLFSNVEESCHFSKVSYPTTTHLPKCLISTQYSVSALVTL